MTYAETVNTDCSECGSTVRSYDNYCWNCGVENPAADRE